MQMARTYERIRTRLQTYRSRMVLATWQLGGATIAEGVRVNGRVVTAGSLSNLHIGPRCTINEGVFLNSRTELRLGEGVRVSPGAQLHTGYLLAERFPRVHDARPIVVHDNVWIAAGAIVSAGVTIGRDSVVAAGAVVVADVPPGVVVGGIPARQIGTVSVDRPD